MMPEAGQRFGPYEILGRLGSGGMGLVFRAWDERLHREVALKLLHDSYSMPGMRERFLLEARAASGLNHSNICTIFDIGEQAGEPYLVMELLEGETLKHRIARGALPVEEIVCCAEEIAAALSAAHAKGIVHRDIKPENIFLVAMANGKSQAKVLDFGLAKIELEASGGWGSRTLDLTLAGGTVGSLAYMSPEQARGESLDGRSDLFSLGAVMYEMATRRPPFRGATSALMFGQLFDHDPEPVREWNNSAPRELERVILKLLAKDRNARFQTAEELREALAKVHAKTGRRWLQRRMASVVPLVRVEDPVARRKSIKQKPGAVRDERGSSSGEIAAEVEGVTGGAGAASTGSSADNLSVRPMRMLEGAPAEAERSVSHPTSESGWPQDARGGQARNGSGAAVPSGVAAGAAEEVSARRLRDGGRTVSDTGRKQRDLEQPRSGAMQFEDGLELAQSAAATSAEVSEDSREAGERRRPKTAAIWVRRFAGAALAIVAVAGFLLLMRSGVLRPMVLRPKEQLLLTVIENKTSDDTLDNTIMQGLEIALRQSNSLSIQGGAAYAAGLRQLQEEGGGAAEAISGQSVAQRVGAKAYVYGQITGSKPYRISIDVLMADTNDKVVSLAEQAASREEIPAAIGRLAQKLRGEVSEDGKVELRRSVAFNQDATANLDALHAFATGQTAMLSGWTEDALQAYRLAATLDPSFVQAQMQLAWMYRAEKAEVASSHAAELAKAAATKASDKVKLLAQFCYQMNFVGDDSSAAATIRAYGMKYPRDVNGSRGLARVLLAEGYLPSSLAAAQQGYGEDPFDPEPYDEAEDALLRLDRYDSVLQLVAEAKRKGVVADGGALAAAYLGGRDGVLAEQGSGAAAFAAGSEAPHRTAVSYAKLESYGRYLDSTGRLGAGLEMWRLAAARAERTPELSSAAGSMLAQAALDRALVESCTVALALAEQLREMPKGPVASFHTAMAAALCGDQTYAQKTITAMQHEFPENTAVMREYVPELRAAAAIGVNEPGRALQGMTTGEGDDGTAMLPYLRGLASAALGQTTLARSDFEAVLGRRGGAWELGGTLYPMAEIGMARTYAADRDKTASTAAYRRFLVTWEVADRRQPLVKEALARSK